MFSMNDFDVIEGPKAQETYCEEAHVPHFAPHDGRCFRCGRNIYSPTWCGTAKSGYFIGITVEYAKHHLITSCPYCNCSFVE